MDVLTVLAIGAVNLLCFYIGARIGQAIINGKEIKAPTLDLRKAVTAREDRRRAAEEQNRIDTIMRNVDGYDGTPYGQEDVPGRGE